MEKVSSKIAKSLNEGNQDFNNEILHSNRAVPGYEAFRPHPGDSYRRIDKIENSG